MNSPKYIFKLGVLLTSALLLTACPEEVEKPEFKTPDRKITQNKSVISIPIKIQTALINKRVLEGIKNPLHKSKSDRLDANLLATESITERQLIKVLVSPAKPGYWAKRFRTVPKQIVESFGCWLKPWKWGDCFRTVTRMVKEEFKVWIEPIKALYKYVSKDIAKLIDKTFKTGVWVGHRIDLTDLKMEFRGNSLFTTAYVKANIQLDYEQAVVPLGPKVKIKGLLNGDILAKVIVQTDIRVKEDASLEIIANESGTKFEITKLLLPTAVEQIDILSLSNAQLYLVKKQLGKLVNEQVTKQVQKQIDNAGDDLKFAEDVKKYVNRASQPFPINEELWLQLNPKKVAVSQVSGQGAGADNHLLINLGVYSKPELVYSKTAPEVKEPEDVMFVTHTPEPQISLYPTINVLYNEVEPKLEAKLKEVINKKYKDKPYTTGKVVIYPSNKMLVFAVDLIKQKNEKLLATVYLWGTPMLDKQNMQLKMDNVNFTVESRNFLVKVADWILHGEVQQAIQNNAVFSYKKDYQKLIADLKNLSQSNEGSEISATVTDINLLDVMASENGIVVYMQAVGKAEVNVGYKTQILPANGKKMIMNFSSPTTIKSHKAVKPAIITKNISNPDDLPKGMLNPFINIGDTIYFVDESGKTQSRIAGPADATVTGESVMVLDKKGNYYELIKN